MLLTTSARTGWLNKAYQGAMSARACASVTSWPEATVATASNANESATFGWSISYLADAVFAASKITFATSAGCDSIATWLESSSYVFAPMRLATKRSSSGCTVRSFLATMYQLGFDLQAVPSTFWVNRSATGTMWVAQTSFCSFSGKSPAKAAVPDGRIHTRPSATSTWEKTSVTGN